MIRSIFVSAAIATGLALASTPSHSAEPDRFAQGTWTGGAHYAPDGRFTHCAARTVSGRASLFVSHGRDGSWALALHHEGWSHAPGTRARLALRVDGGPGAVVHAKAAAPGLLGLPLPRDGAFVSKLRRGRALSARIGGETLRFDLAGSHRALDRLEACRARTPMHLSAETGPSLGARRAEAQEAGRIIARGLGLRHEPIPPSAQPGLYETLDAVWRMDGRLASLRILASGDLTAIDAGLASEQEARCGGRFTSGNKPDPRLGARALRRVAMCRVDGALVWTSAFAIYPRRAGGHYLLEIFAPGDAAEATIRAGEAAADIAVAGL